MNVFLFLCYSVNFSIRRNVPKQHTQTNLLVEISSKYVVFFLIETYVNKHTQQTYHDSIQTECLINDSSDICVKH